MKIIYIEKLKSDAFFFFFFANFINNYSEEPECIMIIPCFWGHVTFLKCLAIPFKYEGRHMILPSDTVPVIKWMYQFIIKFQFQKRLYYI